MNQLNEGVINNIHNALAIVQAEDWEANEIADAIQEMKALKSQLYPQWVHAEFTNHQMFNFLYGVMTSLDKSIGQLQRYLAQHFSHQSGGYLGESIVKAVVGHRDGPSPSVRKWLEKYGNLSIVRAKLVRQPISFVLETLLNVISLGKLNKNKERSGIYDRLVHLYLVIKLTDGSIHKVEKNQVVSMKPTSWEQSNPKLELTTSLLGNTMNKLINKAQDKVGSKQLWNYNPITANCQKFIWDLLQAGGHNSQKEYQFVHQDVTSVFEDLGLLKDLVTGVTSGASKADLLLQGTGFRRKR